MGAQSTPGGEKAAPARPSPWKPLELIKVSAEYLAERGVVAARLDAELLLAHVLGVPRLRLYLDFERPIVPAELDRYRELIRERGRRVPLQLLTGEAHLFDLTFQTRAGVFLPRPETETLVETAFELFAHEPPPSAIVEVGVGTGCVGLSLLARWPAATLTGFDVDQRAVELAASNARALRMADRVSWVAGDAFASPRVALEGITLVVSNPPYVPTGTIEQLEPEVRDHDPRVALDGGLDGLDVIRRLASWSSRVLRPGGWLAFEHGHDQAQPCAELLTAAGYQQVRLAHDLARRPRVTMARKAIAGASEG